MALTALDHFLIRASDLEATKTFYTDVLGLKEGWRPSFPFPGHWFYLGEAPCVHLVGPEEDSKRNQYLGEETKDARRKQGSGAVDHIAFRAKRPAAFIERFETLGIPFRKRGIESLIQIFVEDPDRVTIELNFDVSEA